MWKSSTIYFNVKKGRYKKMKYYKVLFEYEEFRIDYDDVLTTGIKFIVTGRGSDYVVQSAKNKEEAKKAAKNWLWCKYHNPKIVSVERVLKGY